MINQTRIGICARIILVALVFQIGICGALAAPTSPSNASLSSIIDQALADPSLMHGIQGVLVQSLRGGSILYEKNCDLALIPASNMKLLVGAAALDLLGPDYRMRTSLYISGEVTSDGALKGDVILVGGGDPVFSYDHLHALAVHLKESGIRSIDGSIIGDDTRFDDSRLGWGWSWDDEPYYYSAQVSALNLNQNVVEVWVRPGRNEGDPASVRVTPLTAYVLIRNDGVTVEARGAPSIRVDRARGRNTILVSGTVPLQYEPETAEEAITVEDPTLFTCRVFSEMLLREGITVKGQQARGVKPDDARMVAAVDSPTLSEMLSMMNKPSDNLIAECLLKTLGAERRNEGTVAAGEDVLMGFLRKIGAQPSAVGVVDGSGLSRANCITPRTLVTVLRYMHRHKHSGIFSESLAVAGVDGTLRRRMTDTAAQGKVKAKTGFLRRVSAISGYVTTKSGEPLAFSILMNNHLCLNRDATAVQDRLLETLAEL